MANQLRERRKARAATDRIVASAGEVLRWNSKLEADAYSRKRSDVSKQFAEALRFDARQITKQVQFDAAERAIARNS